MWLLATRLALLVVPFRKLASRFGAFVPPQDSRVQGTLGASSTPGNVRVAREVSWAVTRAARHVPFKAACLPQAMTARIMLRRRGVASVMHFGAAKGTKPGKAFEAHAWLDAAGVEVTGYPVAQEFTEIASFV